jgi:viologen exporter family transport system permease protein
MGIGDYFQKMQVRPLLAQTATSEAIPRRATAWGVVRKYFNIYRVSLMERMAYRGDFLLASVLRFLPLVTTILLWRAAYDYAPDKLAHPESGVSVTGVLSSPLGQGPLLAASTVSAMQSVPKRFQGFTFDEMIAYLLLVHISRMFSSMPGLAGGIARDIREGTLKKYLVQPLDLIGYLLSYRAAHKSAYIATSVVPYAILFALFAGFLQSVELPGGARLAAYVASLLLGFVVGFFFESCVGLIGFWFLEITSFLYVVNTVNFFVSGHLFPLDLLPGFWLRIFKLLPFQYMAYFPAAIFLGKVPDDQLVPGLVVEAAWAVGLIVLARVLYALGLRRYSAFGG